MIKFFKNIFLSYKFIFNQISFKLKFLLLITLFLINCAALLDLLMIFSVGNLFSSSNQYANLFNNFNLSKIDFVFIVIFSTLFASLLRLFCSKSILFIGDKVYVSTSIKFYESVFNKDIEFIDKINVERLTSLVFNNASRIPESLFFLQNIISSSLIIIFILSFCAINSYSFLLYYLFCGCLVIYISSGLLASLKTRNVGLSYTKSFEDLSKLFKEMIYSSRYIKTTNRNITYFHELLKAKLKRKRLSQSTELFYSGLPRITAEPTIYCGIAILYLIFRNMNIQIADVSLAIFASVRILPQLQIISTSIPILNASSYQIIDLAKVWLLINNLGNNKANLPIISSYINNNILKKILVQNIYYKIPKFDFFKDDLIESDRKTNFIIKVEQFSLEKGKSYILTSKSGAGKSVFLDLLAGLRKPQKGKVTYFSESGILSRKPKLRYVYQNEEVLGKNILSYLLGRQIKSLSQVLPNELELIEDLRLNLGIDFFPNIKKSSTQYLQNTFANQFPYSGGQKQRIILWSALIEKPELIFLDESLSALDDKSAKNILKFILKLFQHSILIFVSHDQSIISDKFFSNQILINKGLVTINGK